MASSGQHSNNSEILGDPNWFEEWLPKQFPAARTFLYNYQSQVVHTALGSEIHDAAENLLAEWEKLDSHPADSAMSRKSSFQ